jgi:hypothetical protein
MGVEAAAAAWARSAPTPASQRERMVAIIEKLREERDERKVR